jgi:hypothetical protein
VNKEDEEIYEELEINKKIKACGICEDDYFDDTKEELINNQRELLFLELQLKEAYQALIKDVSYLDIYKTCIHCKEEDIHSEDCPVSKAEKYLKGLK